MNSGMGQGCVWFRAAAALLYIYKVTGQFILFSPADSHTRSGVHRPRYNTFFPSIPSVSQFALQLFAVGLEFCALWNSDLTVLSTLGAWPHHLLNAVINSLGLLTNWYTPRFWLSASNLLRSIHNTPRRFSFIHSLKLDEFRNLYCAHLFVHMFTKRIGTVVTFLVCGLSSEKKHNLHHHTGLTDDPPPVISKRFYVGDGLYLPPGFEDPRRIGFWLTFS